MKARTHMGADSRLCGTPLELGEGSARVALKTTDLMAVDEHGLVHGAFVFSVADYAAMLAVNEPNVVLAAAEIRFLKPVRRGDRVVASARTTAVEGRNHKVQVEAVVESETVFEGIFSCIVLEQHVLDEDRGR